MLRRGPPPDDRIEVHSGAQVYQRDDSPENLEVFRTRLDHMRSERRHHAATDCRERSPKAIGHFRSLRQPGEPTHPGVIFRFRYRGRLGLLQGDVATLLGWHPIQAHYLEAGRKRITPVVAAGLAEISGRPATFWLALQDRYDKWHRRGPYRYARSEPEV